MSAPTAPDFITFEFAKPDAERIFVRMFGTVGGVEKDITIEGDDLNCAIAVALITTAVVQVSSGTEAALASVKHILNLFMAAHGA